MYPVSSRWAPALTSDHGFVARVSVLYGGALVAQDIPFTDGAVQVDGGSDIRRSLSLTVADPADWEKYSVTGHELVAEAGVRYLDGSIEWVPLGHFVITGMDGDVHTGPVGITADGREVLLKRAPFETATSNAGYTSAGAFIQARILDVLPDAGFVDESSHGSEYAAKITWDLGADRLSALQEVAAAIGAELFCDAAGTFVLRDVPDPDDTSALVAWDVSAGEAGVMVSANRGLSSDGVYNRVIVTGENAEEGTAPVSATATINDPADPLRYGGPFGKSTFHLSSSLANTVAKAQIMANAELVKRRQPNRTVSLSTVPNAALEAGDRIRVNYGPVADPEIHIARSFTVPLSVGSGGFTIETVSGKAE